MNYTKIFDPQRLTRFDGGTAGSSGGDRRDGRIYRYSDEIVLAVNVALATGRPLLVSGPSGSGKSSLALNAARVLRRRYFEHVVTSRTEARDLLWRFDPVRRLGEAQAAAAAAVSGGPPDTSWKTTARYIEPGVLWWVFDPAGAARRGAAEGAQVPPARSPSVYEPNKAAHGAVVLIDEIDKADPDFPNSLLVPLGSQTFTVEETGVRVRYRHPGGGEPRPEELPLIIITTNNERRLPQAFLRRCVLLKIPPPGVGLLVEIATALFGPADEVLYKAIAETMERMAQTRSEPAAVAELSIAEYLDAVRATLRLRAATLDPTLPETILAVTTWKETGLR